MMIRLSPTWNTYTTIVKQCVQRLRRINFINSRQTSESLRTLSSVSFDKSKYCPDQLFSKWKITPLKVVPGPKCMFFRCMSSVDVNGIHKTGDLSFRRHIATENLVEVWLNEVKLFGTVAIQNLPIDVILQPLDPVCCPESNKSIVEMYYTGSSDQNILTETLNEKGRMRATETRSWKLSELGRLCDLSIKPNKDNDRLEISCGIPPGVVLPLVCVISIPVKFNVEVNGSNFKTVAIRHLESDKVLVRMGSGDCTMVGLKTAATDVHCNNGNITCEQQLLGSLNLHCKGLGSITGDRFQGTNIVCTTEAGSINVKTIYAAETTCSSQSGNVSIRDLHGDTSVCLGSGNLTIGSLDGMLNADLEVGSADVFISRPETVSITASKGDVTLKLTEDCACSFDLDAHTIQHENSLNLILDGGRGCINGGSGVAVVRVTTKQGTVFLKAHDWLSTLKLPFGQDSS